VLADGPADRILRDDLLRRAFGITVRRVDTPDGPAILPV
jgi:iron complex transport system ATP-binding protein